MGPESDQIFLQILREEKNITNFLDTFFGFLYRCTDFYVESTPEQRLGFPPGVAEKLVTSALQKWQNIYSMTRSKKLPVNHPPEKIDVSEKPPSAMVLQQEEVPQVVQEIEVDTSNKTDLNNVLVPSGLPGKEVAVASQLSDSYNGAIRDNYTWSQTITDLDVLVKVPNTVRTAKDIKVDIKAQKIKVEAKANLFVICERTNKNQGNAEWTVIFEGELCHKTKPDESVWSIIPGQHVTIHLEKGVERWWDALIVGESKIELNKIDCSRNLDELGSMEQMKVQELMWNHQQKLLGKPTSEEIKMQGILKKAWDAEGSPFQGMSYDPSILKYN